MTDRMREEDLEATLRDIGARLDYPRPVAMAAAVRARLRDGSRRAPWRLAFAPAFVTLGLFALAIALASPQARAAADELLRLRGLEIFRVQSVPATLPPAKVTFEGERVTLGDARARLSMPVRVPSSTRLGTPDDVYVERTATSERLTLVYRQRAGIPVSRDVGVSALVVAVRGSLEESLLGKSAGGETRVEAVNVSGARGYWLEGAPHVFFFRDASGNARDETLRLAGNTLVWDSDGVTYRLEAQITRDEALRIAATFR